LPCREASPTQCGGHTEIKPDIFCDRSEILNATRTFNSKDTHHKIKKQLEFFNSPRNFTVLFDRGIWDRICNIRG
jgi:hypothetical protein